MVDFCMVFEKGERGMLKNKYGYGLCIILVDAVKVASIVFAASLAYGILTEGLPHGYEHLNGIFSVIFSMIFLGEVLMLSVYPRALLQDNAWGPVFAVVLNIAWIVPSFMFLFELYELGAFNFSSTAAHGQALAGALSKVFIGISGGVALVNIIALIFNGRMCSGSMRAHVRNYITEMKQGSKTEAHSS